MVTSICILRGDRQDIHFANPRNPFDPLFDGIFGKTGKYEYFGRHFQQEIQGETMQ